MVMQVRSNGFSVKAYRGDAKTLLAFDITPAKATNLAGFTVGFSIDDGPTRYLSNQLAFADPTRHAQDPTQPPDSTVNAPLHKFRWVHVPGTGVLGERAAFGTYTYAVTPRYFDDHGALLALDAARTVTLAVEVAPFVKGALTAAFTRGFTQSEAFVHRFGEQAIFRPAGDDLLYSTVATSGTAPDGASYTFRQEYAWLGFTARDTILNLLDEVQHDAMLDADVFAYDLNEPDIVAALLALAADGRVRLILDDAALHHGTKNGVVPPEDQVETAFTAAARAPAAIKRGHFARYSHDKVIVVHRRDAQAASTPVKVLTGSTNFSVTGLYVNSNHVLVYDDPTVAAAYATVFQQAWDSGVKAPAFRTTPASTTPTTFTGPEVPKTVVTFAPHTAATAGQILDDLAARIAQEATVPHGSVLFAVMAIDSGGGAVYPALRDLHTNTAVFSYGISDAPAGISLYTPRHRTGVLVTGKPGRTDLPPPFDQVPTPANHQVHHKFVVCGFNGRSPVVYCGSSNLALGGETDNGDNLIAIHDEDVATVFAIEALLLVDHFDFLDSRASNTPSTATTGTSKPFTLSTTDAWTKPYFDPDDLHSVDRQLFG